MVYACDVKLDCRRASGGGGKSAVLCADRDWRGDSGLFPGAVCGESAVGGEVKIPSFLFAGEMLYLHYL